MAGHRITKLELAEYFVTVGPWFMPIVGHRPITLQRFPDGDRRRGVLREEPAARRSRVRADRHPDLPVGRKHPQLVLDELAVAVWAVQMNTITLHPWPVSVTGEKGDTDNPDELRIDLDPQPGRDFHDAAVAALELKAVLADLGLTAYAKTSGNRGVHVHARIEPSHEFLDVRHGVIAIARELERRLPELVTTSWWKEERGEKVFVDFNQANRDRTIASAFSPRPLKGAPVSMPVAWDDLTDVSPSDFTVRTVPPLVEKGKDPWASMPDSVGSIEGALAWWERDVADGLPERTSLRTTRRCRASRRAFSRRRSATRTPSTSRTRAATCVTTPRSPPAGGTRHDGGDGDRPLRRPGRADRGAGRVPQLGVRPRPGRRCGGRGRLRRPRGARRPDQRERRHLAAARGLPRAPGPGRRPDRAGRRPNPVNGRGQTALVAAVFRQNLAIVEALLGAGADPALGSPDARATAAYFPLPVMASLLNR